VCVICHGKLHVFSSELIKTSYKWNCFNFCRTQIINVMWISHQVSSQNDKERLKTSHILSVFLILKYNEPNIAHSSSKFFLLLFVDTVFIVYWYNHSFEHQSEEIYSTKHLTFALIVFQNTDNKHTHQLML